MIVPRYVFMVTNIHVIIEVNENYRRHCYKGDENAIQNIIDAKQHLNYSENEL